MALEPDSLSPAPLEALYIPMPPPLLKRTQTAPSAPILKSRIPNREYPTPMRAKVQGAYKYMLHLGHQPNKEHIFKVFDIKKKTPGYEAINAESSHRLNNRRGLKEKPCYRPIIVSSQKY